MNYKTYASFSFIRKHESAKPFDFVVTVKANNYLKIKNLGERSRLQPSIYHYGLMSYFTKIQPPK